MGGLLIQNRLNFLTGIVRVITSAASDTRVYQFQCFHFLENAMQ